MALLRATCEHGNPAGLCPYCEPFAFPPGSALAVCAMCGLSAARCACPGWTPVTPQPPVDAPKQPSERGAMPEIPGGDNPYGPTWAEVWEARRMDRERDGVGPRGRRPKYDGATQAERNRQGHLESYRRHRDRLLADAKADPKVRARRQLHLALKHGEVRKPERCEGCGEIPPPSKLHGHHDDYDRPLAVRWLCLGCHRALHSAECARVLA